MQKYLGCKKGFSLYSLLLVFLATLLLPCAESSGAGSRKRAPVPSSVTVEMISAEQAKVLGDIGAAPVMVDTRSEEAFRKMHITGAVNLPWKEAIEEPADLPRNRLLVVYCDCLDDSTSSDVARQLIRDYGYTEVKVLRSGLGSWICLNYPIEGDISGSDRCQ